MTTLGHAELRSILTFTVSLARAAGDSHSGRLPGHSKNSVDLVTEYDVAVENLVMSEIKKAIGEESYSSGTRPELTDEPTFCTELRNFVHGVPFACISLGLIYQKRPVLGVIYNPFLQHLYTGIENQGSFLTCGTGSPVKLPLANPKPLPSLSKALIAVDPTFLRLAGDPNDGVPGGRMSHSLRSLGSGALNIAAVARGSFDMFWPWDVCAGIVIAQEAGGVVTGSHAVLASAAADPSVDPFKVTPEILTGRKYLIIRKIPDTPQETGREAQLRIAKEFYETVEDCDPK
ncbi:myo inositol monophosphatase [Pisolithus marmoratus]|nr:myo inositol monophosphatase [Pisolithus marmoratus]